MMINKNIRRINILLVALFLVAGVFVYVLLFRKSSELVVTIKVGENNVYYWPWKSEGGSRPWFSNAMRVGMKELDGLGRVQAEVLDTYVFDTAPNRRAVYLTVRLKTVYNKASNTYTYKGMNLLLGSTIKLNLDELFIEGLITGVDGFTDNRKKVRLVIDAVLKDENDTYLETSGVDPHIADAISVGDKIYDNKGNVLIEVLEKRANNALRITVNSAGVTRVASNPLRRDVDLELLINAYETGGRYYVFDDIPILVGMEIPYNTKHLSIFPEVVAIKEIN